ncbi:MAG: valine--tRNA ligase [Candidatus Berkelbacteria bacterium]|nr:MAG: valine--tRNA ligase [Candidatus Berkelbacteria bacterium]QQG51732.1 MAG: valine--tRNA ligase [Candidatus Berkelbacteria bacterium]
MKEIPTRYDHTNELERYEQWERAGDFEPKGSGEPFSIVIPPPNVTGDLHLGHGLSYTTQDVMGRHQRRLGKKVLVLPGADHAAIAVQALVEKKIQKEKGQSRTQLGREAFLKEVLDWIDHYMPRLQQSMRRLGLGADWSRWRFTMDEHSQQAVRTAFVELHKQGLIYRSKYLVNWDPKLQTAVSDDEVNYQEVPGKLYWIKYGPITLATTRPETKFGDTAIAVHPDDHRYKDFVGKEVEVTLVTGEKKTVPVIADDVVDPEFGTGAVKVTPAHDRTDFEIGQRHKLPSIEVIDQYGKLTAVAGKFAGMKAGEARELIAKEMIEMGLMEKVTDYTLRQPISERSGAVIEPRLSTQWFMKTTELKNEAVKAVKSGAIKFHPKSIEKTYSHWFENLHDWCISRQLWWGHAIPAWYCVGTDKGQCKPGCKEPIVALEKPKTCPHCGSNELTQDEDVLDTWFSSGIWPFSTLGWPDKSSEDLKTFFPTDFLMTGADILFFWVARMIMMSQALMKDVPFKAVYFHGLILDESGQKMSKSKGNVLDLMALIDKYGTDAVRMGLLGSSAAGQNQRFSEQKILKYRNFVTKIWNASRFVAEVSDGAKIVKQGELDETEKKFLANLETLERNNLKYFEKFQFNLALDELYEFFWNDFASTLLEYEKSNIRDNASEERTQKAQYVLREALERQLIMIGDFAPYVTDEIKRTMLP